MPLVTPHGHLQLALDSDAPPLPAALAQRLSAAFARGSGHGLLHLGAAEVGSILPPCWAWWRDLAARYVTALCTAPEDDTITTPDDEALDAMIADAPPMAGAPPSRNFSAHFIRSGIWLAASISILRRTAETLRRRSLSTQG